MATVAAAQGHSSLTDVQLGQLLQERGVINEHQLVEALRAQAAGGGRLGTILVRRGCISDAQLDAALRTQDEVRRAGVTLDLAVVAAERSEPRSVALALSMAVPHAGSQGGLPHHGVVARQHLLVPPGWLPSGVTARDGAGRPALELRTTDGRIVDYAVALLPRASGDPLSLCPGRPSPCAAGEPRDGGFEAVTVLVRLSPDSLRDGGAGRFAGAFTLRFGEG